MGNALWRVSRRIVGSGLVEFIGNLAMGGNKITGLAAGSDPADAVRFDQLPEIPAPPTIPDIRRGLVTLVAGGTTHVSLLGDTAPQILGSVAGPFNLVAVGSGGTVPIKVDGAEAQNLTINFTQGKHDGGSSPATDLTSEVDNKIKISVDGDTAETVTFDWSGCNSGALIAAQMQTAIRALGGKKAQVTVEYTTKYTITSPTKGTNSTIRLARADSLDVCDELKLGADYGTDTDGTGHVEDATAVQASEIVAAINTQFAATTCYAEVSAGKVLVKSETLGESGSLEITTTDLATALGLVSAAVYGTQGLGYEDPMEDSNYQVAATLVGASTLLGKFLSVENKTPTGFDLVCADVAAVDDVGLIVF